MSASRERILAALWAGRGAQAATAAPVLDEARLFRDGPGAGQTLLDVFRERLAGLSAELWEVHGDADGAERLCQLLREVPGPVAAIRFSLLDRLAAASPPLAEALATAHDFPEDPRAFAAYAMGITPAEALVARTGSVFLRSDRSGGRQLSVLPPVHVVVASTSQLVPSLGDALAEFEQQAGECSFATFVTGPSRTADIEKILVLGAHGPKRLVVLLLPE